MSATTQAYAQPYRFTAPLTLCLDIKLPQCYLALPSAFELEDELAINLSCLPFSLPALKPPIPAGPESDRGTRHRSMRAHYFKQDILRYAAARKLTLKNLFRTPDTTQFNLGFLWLNLHFPQGLRRYLTKGFEGYWDETLDIEEPACIRNLMQSLDANLSGYQDFAKTEGPHQLAKLQTELKAAGVFDVPSFIADGEIFVGRAHTPLLRWILSGREGAPPVTGKIDRD